MTKQNQVRPLTRAECEPNAVAFSLNIEAFAAQHADEKIRQFRFLARNARDIDEQFEELRPAHEFASLDGRCATNIVPLPSLVNTSARIASESTPETM